MLPICLKPAPLAPALYMLTFLFYAWAIVGAIGKGALSCVLNGPCFCTPMFLLAIWSISKLCLTSAISPPWMTRPWLELYFSGILPCRPDSYFCCGMSEVSVTELFLINLPVSVGLLPTLALWMSCGGCEYYTNLGAFSSFILYWGPYKRYLLIN